MCDIKNFITQVEIQRKEKKKSIDFFSTSNMFFRSCSVTTILRNSTEHSLFVA